MKELKLAIKSSLVFSVAFLLYAGGIAIASPLGTKDELNLEFIPSESESEATEKKPIAQLPEQPSGYKAAAKPIQVTPDVKTDTDKPETAPAPIPVKSAKIVPTPIKEAKSITPQKIKTHPIKVEDKVAEPAKKHEVKKPEPAGKPVVNKTKPVERPDIKRPAVNKQNFAKKDRVEKAEPVSKPAPVKKAEPVKKIEVKKDVIKLPEPVRALQPPGKDVGLLNRWFGLETGVASIKMRRKAGAEIMVGSGPEGIYTQDDCINIAIKNSIPVQIAEKGAKLAHMRVIEARRNMLPTATLVWEPYSGKVNQQRYYGRKQYIEGKQPIFHGGELFFTLKQSEVNLEITRRESAKTKNELILQVKKAYYSLAKSDDNYKLQLELSGEVDHIFQMVNDQYDAKVASKLELLNVSSQSSQIKYQLASAEGDVSVAELILKQAMNVDPDVSIRIKPKLEFHKVEVKYEEALKAALTNRPEVIINTLMIDYYLYGKKIALSKGLPKVDILGSWGLSKETYMPIDNAFANTGWGNVQGANTPIIADQKLQQQWYAGVKASVPAWGSTGEYSFTQEQWTPTVATFQGTEAKTNSFKFKLFDNLAMYSEKQSADIDFDRARQELNKIKQDVTLEVKEQCFNYQKALIQLDTASYKMKYQESDFEFIKMKRSLDEVPDSSVIESMIKLSQERFGYVQALTDCHTSVASINKAIGVKDYFKDESAAN